MSDEAKAQITQLLEKSRAGADENAINQLVERLYTELHDLAAVYFRKERMGHTLQPTALVHEAYLKLVDRAKIDWQGEAHFFAVCARAMRQVLVDHARRKRRLRRGGDQTILTIDERIDPHKSLNNVDALEFNELLEKLERLDARQAKVVELRFFGGLSIAQIADYLGVSKRTIEGDWTHARAWLAAELSRDRDS